MHYLIKEIIKNKDQENDVEIDFEDILYDPKKFKFNV
jgi:hypothetical protein